MVKYVLALLLLTSTASAGALERAALVVATKANCPSVNITKTTIERLVQTVIREKRIGDETVRKLIAVHGSLVMLDMDGWSVARLRKHCEFAGGLRW
ncbi:hypothetical protein ACUN0C_19060 [Faunimonas sp. B44]|uniref:hypothetical protein n=1 Tax=Faunimonas sp. B44 TaxID=3461493 RepID=UPI0040442856